MAPAAAGSSPEEDVAPGAVGDGSWTLGGSGPANDWWTGSAGHETVR